ncbi:putative poly(A)-specific ribonuclease PARN-like domain-containing protein 1 [Apostichopus japonicus]|uniref:Putative poly(A)-specific ribonuclease PARN-like domain-containing protein 1 n=1 Tax=Stichopus japonicus TaxID=307972 RepID=A0A2G8K9D4_STIJA|nr:putative poly(A)-specific ribonuclease PARN-like domain-containing protein 1 [Apostichopus japonicus]
MAPNYRSVVLRAKSLDLEFSGLTAEIDHVNSLFDSAEFRYQKLKMMAKKFTIPQFGLTAFVKTKETNCYKAYTYNFYIFPASWGSVDSWLTCQASSLKFLCCHEFDFNKWIYKGVSYLSIEQEEELKSQMKQSPYNLARDIDDDYMLKEILRKVRDWLMEEQEDVICLGEFDALQRLYLQLALKKAFPSVHVEIKDSGEVVASRLTSAESSTNEHQIAENLLDNLLGFSKVIRLLIKSKKPLIGHNCLTDMLLIYENFIHPLPDKLSEFKKIIHDLFPVIIDTKILIRENRKSLRGLGIDIGSTALQSLYLTLKNSAAKLSALNPPTIIIHHTSPKYEHAEHLHEAGYDSYLAGFIFIKLAHMLTVTKLGRASSPLITFHDYVQSIQPSVNKLYLMRANVGYVSLKGSDPSYNIPGWLYVQSKDSSALDASELAELFEGYSTVDVRLIDRKTAIIAVSSFIGCRNILKDFKSDGQLLVRKYNIFQHNKLVRYSLWGSLALMGAICVWALLGDQKSSDVG